MANHSATKKSVRKTNTRRLKNRYYGRTTRNLIKDLRNATKKKDAEAMMPKVVSEIDKLAKRAVIHKRNAANLKSKLMKMVNKLS